MLVHGFHQPLNHVGHFLAQTGVDLRLYVGKQVGAQSRDDLEQDDADEDHGEGQGQVGVEQFKQRVHRVSC